MRQTVSLVLLLLIASLALATAQAAVTPAPAPGVSVTACTTHDVLIESSAAVSAATPNIIERGGTVAQDCLVDNSTRLTTGNTPSATTSCTSAQKMTTTLPAATAMIRRVAGGVTADSDVPQLGSSQLAAAQSRQTACARQPRLATTTTVENGIGRSQTGFDDAGGFIGGSAT